MACDVPLQDGRKPVRYLGKMENAWSAWFHQSFATVIVLNLLGHYGMHGLIEVLLQWLVWEQKYLLTEPSERDVNSWEYFYAEIIGRDAKPWDRIWVWFPMYDLILSWADEPTWS